MQPIITKNFSLYPSDLEVVKKLAKTIKQAQGNSQADSAALRKIIRDWAEMQKNGCHEQPKNVTVGLTPAGEKAGGCS